MEVATKSFRLLRVKECDINITMWLKCGDCHKVATEFDVCGVNAHPLWETKTWRIFQKHSKNGATICLFSEFFFESVENVSKNPIEFTVTGESVESVEDRKRYYRWYVRRIHVSTLSTLFFPNLGQRSQKIF